MEDCSKNLKFIRNEVITAEAFMKIIKKHSLNNPLVDMVLHDDWKSLGTELYLIGEWMRNLRGINNLDRVNEGLLKNYDDYSHSRLQLKLGSKLIQHKNCSNLVFKPEINGTNKPDIMADIEAGRIYIELATKKELKRERGYLALPEKIRSILKKRNNINEPISIFVRSKIYPSEEQIKNVLDEFSKNDYEMLPIDIEIGPINIKIVKSECNLESVISGGVDKFGNKFGAATLYKPLFEKILHDKIKQLPRNFPGVLIIEISELGTLSTEFDLYDVSDENFLNHIKPNFNGDYYKNLLGVLILKISKHEEISEELVKIYPIPNNKCENEVNLYDLEPYLPAPYWWEGKNCTKQCHEIFGDLKKYVSNIDIPTQITKRYKSITYFEKPS